MGAMAKLSKNPASVTATLHPPAPEDEAPPEAPEAPPQRPPVPAKQPFRGQRPPQRGQGRQQQQQQMDASALTRDQRRAYYAGVKDAPAPSAMGDWNYMRAGKYLVRVDRVKEFFNRTGIFCWAMEGTILHVFDSHQETGHTVGEVVTHYVESTSDYFLKDIKGLIVAALKCNPAEIDEDDCLDTADEEQPLAGFVLPYHGHPKVSQKGNDYTVIRYQPRWNIDAVRSLLPPERFKEFFPDAEAA
jgi:hypothetical protein